MGNELTVNWVIKGKVYECEIVPGICPNCGAVNTIVILPAPLRAQQTDGTTHVCMPSGFGGCNHGFAMVGAAAPEAKAASNG